MPARDADKTLRAPLFALCAGVAALCCCFTALVYARRCAAACAARRTSPYAQRRDMRVQITSHEHRHHAAAA